ncbi:MAG TPA: retropepsin-like aspartic protease [Blastocatellia bacterium]|nr:retropepsin-like aspartic protease [Blastocatellia bacterium]
MKIQLTFLSAVILFGAAWPVIAPSEPRTRSLSGIPKVATLSPAHSAIRLEIPFQNIGGHIFLKVNVKGNGPYWFIFDTGNPSAILDMSRAKELGLTLKGSFQVGGAGENTELASLVQDCPYTIPGLDGFTGRIAVALPLAVLKPHMGHDVDGILGADFIRQFVAEVDYISNVMRLYDRASYQYSGSGESIPISFNSASHPIMKVQLIEPGRDPIEGNFVADLGSGGSLILNRPYVEEEHLIMPGDKTINMRMGGGIGGGITGLVGRVAALKIGHLTIEKPLALFSTDTKGATSTSKFFQGNIGFLILRKFKVILDYGNKRIILEPNSRFKRAHRLRYGLPANDRLSGLHDFQSRVHCGWLSGG